MTHTSKHYGDNINDNRTSIDRSRQPPAFTLTRKAFIDQVIITCALERIRKKGGLDELGKYNKEIYNDLLTSYI